MFDDKSIFISGGTGSFGRNFIERLLEQYRPRRVVVFSRDELKQYEMQQSFTAPCMRWFLGDVRDAERLRQAMRGIDFVVHAAALKHVPAAEYNPTECIRTNVNGAENIIAAAIENGVEKVVALSTKLLSDKLFVAANSVAGQQKTRFAVVRYDNAGVSRGSLLPFFNTLISHGADELPTTEPRVTRFLIALEHRVQFVMDSFARMHGGEVFVPQIPSIRMVDLATGLAPEFADCLTREPSTRFNNSDADFALDSLGEQGSRIAEDLAYLFDVSPHFLSVAELSDLHSTLPA